MYVVYYQTNISLTKVAKMNSQIEHLEMVWQIYQIVHVIIL